MVNNSDNISVYPEIGILGDFSIAQWAGSHTLYPINSLRGRLRLPHTALCISSFSLHLLQEMGHAKA